MGNTKITQEASDAFIAKCKDKFPHLDYSASVYTGNSHPFRYSCPAHGQQVQLAKAHVRSPLGCKECSKEAGYQSRKQKTLDSRIDKIKSFHPKLTVNEAAITGDRGAVTFTCPEHGPQTFCEVSKMLQSPTGCPACSNSGTSSGQRELLAYVKSVYDGTVVEGDRKVLDGQELDIYVPERKLAIEFNGVFWHSDKRKDKNYHANKTRKCREQGIYLMHVSDIDWSSKQKKIKDLIANKLGLSTSYKINARDCVVEELEGKDASEFVDTYHIQGCKVSTEVRLGLRHPVHGLVAVMLFGKGKTLRGTARTGKEAPWELSRFATNHSVRGGASKLFKYAVNKYRMGVVKSLSDNDFFDGKLYETLGFQRVSETVDYQVYHPKLGLLPKYQWQRRAIPKRLAEIGSATSFDPRIDTRTEWQLEDEVGALRFWNSGKITWLWRNST